MASLSSLRIAVLGVGKIGSTFAFQLSRSGNHDVTVVARPGSERLKQLKRDKGIVNIKGERAEVRVTDALDEQTPYDLVIVTMPAYQVDAVLPALRRSSAQCIRFMLVTFQPERLREAVGAERCSFGMPFVQALFVGDGKLKATINAAQKTIMSRSRWVEVFNAAGVPAAVEPDMPLWLRCHVPLCVAFESASVAGERRRGGASWGEAVVLARGVRESYALIKGLGHEIYPQAKARLSGAPTWVLAGILCLVSRMKSMRELLATGERECRALVDVMAAAAPLAKPGVRLPKILAMKPV
jgi:2-dehydropantoate 2-reductase